MCSPEPPAPHSAPSPDRQSQTGNDGLTAAERATYAARYAKGPGRGMTDANRATIAALRPTPKEEP